DRLSVAINRKGELLGAPIVDGGVEFLDRGYRLVVHLGNYVLGLHSDDRAGRLVRNAQDEHALDVLGKLVRIEVLVFERPNYQAREVVAVVGRGAVLAHLDVDGYRLPLPVAQHLQGRGLAGGQVSDDALQLLHSLYLFAVYAEDDVARQHPALFRRAGFEDGGGDDGFLGIGAKLVRAGLVEGIEADAHPTVLDLALGDE